MERELLVLLYLRIISKASVIHWYMARIPVWNRLLPVGSSEFSWVVFIILRALMHQILMIDEKANLNQWVCLSKILNFGSINFHREVIFPIKLPMLNVLLKCLYLDGNLLSWTFCIYPHTSLKAIFRNTGHNYQK